MESARLFSGKVFADVGILYFLRGFVSYEKSSPFKKRKHAHARARRSSPVHTQRQAGKN
jgi:hypothetical protein